MDDFEGLYEKEPAQTVNWWDSIPRSLEERLHILQVRAHKLQADDEEGRALRFLLDLVEDSYKEVAGEVKKQYGIAFFKPSYEQSLLLNAWIWGIDFIVCFAANRIGKTAGMGVINPCLWILPNNPEWEMFAAHLAPNPEDQGETFIDNPHSSENYYVDLFGRPVQTIERPNIRALDEIRDVLKRHPQLMGDPTKSHLDPENAEKFATLQKLAPSAFRPAFPRAPINESGTLWLGAPDSGFHQDIILKEWKRWLPHNAIKKWSENDKSALGFTLNTREETNPTPQDWTVLCKSYESEDTKWSGAAVHGIVLTEGITSDVLNEVKQRLKVNGFASWDYTPYEARNVGAKTALAYRVHKGEEELPLRAHIFTRFSARNAPAHILPTAKKDDLIRMWHGKKEGEARLDGIFYSTSPQILSRLDRPFHCVPWSIEELFRRYPTGQVYRGFDPGYDHPSVCCWGLLVPGDIWFIYRYYIERHKTIPERCADIIKLSNNATTKISVGKGSHEYYLKEIHHSPISEVATLTAADYHMFQVDQVTGQSNAVNYIREGLVLTESTHMSPKDRATNIDKLLARHDYHTHPITGNTPGAKLFFLINGPGVDQALSSMEALFWERYSTGSNRGLEKDTVPTHGDDELDATCYITCGPYRWSNYQAKRENGMILTPDNFEEFDPYVAAYNKRYR